MAEKLFNYLKNKIFLKGNNGTLTLHIADGVPLKLKWEITEHVDKL